MDGGGKAATCAHMRREWPDQLAIDSLTHSPASGWMSKQMTGTVNNAITGANSPVIAYKSATARQQKRHKEMRFVSHTSQSVLEPERENRGTTAKKNLRGNKIGSQALSSLTLHLLHLLLFLPTFSLSLSCTQKENTDISVTSPRQASEWSLDTEI